MKPAVKPTAHETQEQQIMRAIAMKRESFFSLILGNLLQNPQFASFIPEQLAEGGDTSYCVKAAIDSAMDGADYAIKKLYNIKPDANDGNE